MLPDGFAVKAVPFFVSGMSQGSSLRSGYQRKTWPTVEQEETRPVLKDQNAFLPHPSDVVGYAQSAKKDTTEERVIFFIAERLSSLMHVHLGKVLTWLFLYSYLLFVCMKTD